MVAGRPKRWKPFCSCYGWILTITALFSLLTMTASFSKKEMTMKASSREKPYRSGVMAVFSNSQTGRVLVFHRKYPRYTNEWQFPQGGVKRFESPEDALFREVMEEAGNNQFRIIRTAEQLVRFDFPEDRRFKMAETFRGQEHQWFLCEYDEGMGPELKKAKDDDFDDYAWVLPQKALELIVPWKREAYVIGLQQLGLL